MTHKARVNMEFLHTEKRRKYYDQVIEIYQKTGFSAYRIANMKLVPVAKHTIQDWINNFVSENGRVTPQITVMKSDETQASAELDALRAKVADLEEQLRKEKLHNLLNEKIIDIAEKRWHIEIRKKAGTKQ